jgi:hypothetical protein
MNCSSIGQGWDRWQMKLERRMKISMKKKNLLVRRNRLGK